MQNEEISDSELYLKNFFALFVIERKNHFKIITLKKLLARADTKV